MIDRMNITGFIKALFVGLGIIRLARLLGRDDQSITVIQYHSISEHADYCTDSIAVSPSMFERQIAFLKKNYRIISLDEVVDCIATEKAFPKGAVAITFDDGYLDNYTQAFPILKKYDVTATFYVTANPVAFGKRFWVGWLQQSIMRSSSLQPLIEEFDLSVAESFIDSPSYRQCVIDQILILINRSDLTGREKLLNRVSDALGVDANSNHGEAFMMSPAQIRDMASRGMTIGSHTLTHPILSSLTDKQALEELERSKSVLEDLLQLPVKHFCFPNGPGGMINYNRQTQQLARQAGYQSAATSRRGVINLSSDSFALKRQGINCKLSHKAFVFKLEERHFKIFLRHDKA